MVNQVIAYLKGFSQEQWLWKMKQEMIASKKIK